MAINVLRSVTSLLSRAKHTLRRPNCKRLLAISRRHAAAIIPFFGGVGGGGGERRRGKLRVAAEKRNGEDDVDDTSSGGSDDEPEVWRRGIIMGEKCEPLDFSGAIYYDCDGRRLAEVPRSPMRSSLPSFLAEGKSWK